MQSAMGLRRRVTTIVFLVATVLCLATTRVVLQEYPGPIQQDLTILKWPPWNYVPGIPGTGCVEPNAFFETDVIFDIQGDVSTGLDSSTLMDLEDAFLTAYNEQRKGFCDDESRSVVEIQADKNSVAIKAIDEFSLRFLVEEDATCAMQWIPTCLQTNPMHEETWVLIQRMMMMHKRMKMTRQSKENSECSCQYCQNEHVAR